MFKRKALPILIGLGLVAAFAAGITLLKSEPRETDLLGPAIRAMKDKYERLGHTLTSDSLRVEILKRTDTEGFIQADLPALRKTHFLRLKFDGAWTVDIADLHDHFEKWLADRQVLQGIGSRLAQGLAARTNSPVEIGELKYSTEIRWLDLPVCSVIVPFTAGAVESQYVEVFAFRDGAWAADGKGQFFERPPQPRRPQ